MEAPTRIWLVMDARNLVWQGEPTKERAEETVTRYREAGVKAALTMRVVEYVRDGEPTP